MQLCDMHVHSTFSVDGVSAMEEMCRAAIQKNISRIAFTEHYDIRSAGGERFYLDGESARLAEFARLKDEFAGKLEILFGVELGQPHHNPAVAAQFLKTREFDFILGSLHVYKTSDNDYHDVYYVDYSSAAPHTMFIDYFTDLQRLAIFGGFDVIAHLDYPLRVLDGFLTHPTVSDYKDLIDTVLKSAAEKGIGLEIGTRGLIDWQKRVGPEDWVLKRFRELGGEIITTGSDSHQHNFLGYGIEQALHAAKRAGFSYNAYYVKRKPYFTKIGE